MARSPSTSANETLSTTSHMSIPLMVKTKPCNDDHDDNEDGDHDDDGVGNHDDGDSSHILVTLRLMLSYHSVQLGQSELIGGQNFIVGASNIALSDCKLCRNIEHFSQLND